MSAELLAAILSGNVTTATSLLESRHIDPNYSEGNSTTDGSPLIPLFQAIIHGYTPLIHLLVNHGANVNQTEDRYNLTPLHFAADYWDKNIFIYLFRHGADIDRLDMDEYTGELHIEVLRARANTIWYLKHYKEFLASIVANNVDAIRETLTSTYYELKWYDGSAFEYSINPNDDAGIHGLPIQLAAQYGSPEILELLVAHGADVNKTSTFNPKTPIYIAIENNKYSNAKMLISHGVSIDTLSKEALSRLLDLAIINNDLVFARELLSKKITPVIINEQAIRDGVIHISPDMRFLLSQYDPMPKLQWLATQALVQAQDSTADAMQSAQQWESMVPELISLALKCRLNPV